MSPNSANSSTSESPTGKSSTRPTTEVLARALRNSDDYDDWDYGTEPIPHDTSWISPSSVLHLYAHLLNKFQAEETVNMGRLAALAVTEILTLPTETLLRLSKTFTP